MEVNKLFIVIKILFCLAEHVCSRPRLEQISKNKLLKILLNQSHYDPSIPPDYFEEQATNVTIQIAIYDIISENEQNMEFSCLMYARMRWIDTRLNYSKYANYSNLKVSGSYIEKVWVPDIFFIQNRIADFTGFVGNNELIYIGMFGDITFSGRIATTILCDMNLQHYPYDVQLCQITLQSYTYTQEEVQLFWTIENPVIMSGNNIREYIKWRNRTFVTPDEKSVGNFSNLNTGIQIKRYAHTASQFISTPVVLVLIALMSFMFGDNFTPRVALSGAAMTTIIMHWAGIYNKIQPASSLVYLDTWMLINLCCVGGIISYTAIIYHFKHPREIEEFKHLMEETIYVQLDKFQRNWPKWDEVKKLCPDKNLKIRSRVIETEKETILDKSLSSLTNDQLTWTVDRRFYAVQNDELRERYYLEFVDSMVKERNKPTFKLFKICKHYSGRFILDVIGFVFFLLCYILFTVVYVKLWKREDFMI